MNHFGTVISQFGSFIGGNDGYEACGRYFSWIGSKDAVDFFPYLKFGCLQSDSAEGGTKVGISSTDLGK